MHRTPRGENGPVHIPHRYTSAGITNTARADSTIRVANMVENFWEDALAVRLRRHDQSWLAVNAMVRGSSECKEAKSGRERALGHLSSLRKDRCRSVSCA